MALVEIVDVVRSESDILRLAGSSIDLPQPNSQSDIYEIDVGGWVLGHDGPPEVVRIVHGDRIVRECSLNIPRAEVGRIYPHIQNAQQCGFWMSCGVTGLGKEFELEVKAVFRGGNRVRLGTIRGRHQPVRSVFQPKLQPLMLTSLGRTGTTWVMRLLSQHPAIATHAAYPNEVRCALYWVHMFTVLAEPANLRQSANPDSLGASPFWVGNHPFHSVDVSGDSSLRDWFGRQYVEDLAGFCQRSIESFYLEVSRTQARANPVYFAEKCRPDQMPRIIWELYPKAREVFLVRDFRDMVCSIFAFNARRGFLSFGREHVADDEAYLAQLRIDVGRFVASWKERSKNAHLVRYEDLILRPESTLKALFDYLELERRPALIQQILEQASASTAAMQQHRTTPDQASSIGRWRREQNPQLRQRCEEVFADILPEFGYETVEA